ncbi:hypothetical protein BBJ28_00000927 [Nothophytophthora sp. Chile5]|nr:hypothetical protein BBJ28_00000927 [Nothophytophthora sp. Chile5]
MAMPTPSAESSYVTSNMTPHVVVEVGGGSTDRMEKKMHQGPDTPHPLRATHVADIGGRNSWDTPFFGCFSSLMPNCCMSTICPCVSIAQIQARMGKCYQTALMSYGAIIFGLVICAILAFSHSVTTDTEPSSSSHPDGENDGHEFHRSAASRQAIFVSCSVLFFLLYSVSVCMLRMRVRTKFEIGGNCGEDCLLATYCAPCTVAQMASETQSYTPGDCNFLPRTDTLLGYPGTPPANYI